MDWRKCANEEEKVFLQQLTAAAHKADKQYRCFATDFYAVGWMQEVVTKYLGEGYLNTITFMGGYEEAERQCALCGYESYMLEDLPVQILEVSVKTGMGKALTHRDYLGALMGLGIERSKIGDIVMKPFGAYIIVSQDLAQYIQYHLLEIGRYGKIEIKNIGFNEMIIEERQFKEITGTVQSLRVDAIFALAFGMSRNAVVKLIQQDKAKRNGMSVKASDVLEVGDIGTLRGFGKMRFTTMNGTTKKDRIHIKVEKYI